MTKDEALQIALKALELWINCKFDEDTAWEAHNAIKESIETKDEPVAWGMKKDGIILDVISPDEHDREEGGYTVPLYTTPQRTWVGLTEEDLKPICDEWRIVYGAWINDFARDIEAKLKEKNT